MRSTAPTPRCSLSDFHDEPFDLSLVQHALSTRQPAKVRGASTPRLLNLVWPALGAGAGSIYFQNFANLLDRLLVNKKMIRHSSPIHADPTSVQIITPPSMVNDGTYPSPIPFGGIGKPVNTNGYSDHYPISVVIDQSD